MINAQELHKKIVSLQTFEKAACDIMANGFTMEEQHSGKDKRPSNG